MSEMRAAEALRCAQLLRAVAESPEPAPPSREAAGEMGDRGRLPNTPNKAASGESTPAANTSLDHPSREAEIAARLNASSSEQCYGTGRNAAQAMSDVGHLLAELQQARQRVKAVEEALMRQCAVTDEREAALQQAREALTAITAKAAQVGEASQIWTLHEELALARAALQAVR